MALTFFKTPKNKPFNYKPVYYDARKEALEKLSKTAYSEAKEDNKNYEEVLRDRMRLRWKRSTQPKSRIAAKSRLFVIMAVLFLLAYLIIYM